MSRKHTPETFWSLISIKSQEQCWEWQSQKNKDGYGMVKYRGKSQSTHRLAYILTFGPIPEGLVIRHSCNNPPCCNPTHLQTGTRKDNSQDMIKAGRAPDGEKGNAKLTNEQVLKMRALYATGKYRHIDLAEMFGIKVSNAGYVINRKTWKHI